MINNFENLRPILKDTSFPHHVWYEIMDHQLDPLPESPHTSDISDPFVKRRYDLWADFSIKNSLPFFRRFDDDPIDPQIRIVRTRVYGKDLDNRGVTEEDLVLEARKIEDALFQWLRDGRPEMPHEEFRIMYMGDKPLETQSRLQRIQKKLRRR